MSMQNKAAALNALHTAINAIVPELQAYIASTPIKFKGNGEMFKNNADAMQAIIHKHLPERARVFVKHYSNNVFALECSTNYKSGEYGATWLNVWASLANFEPMRTDFKAEDFTTAQQEWEALDEQIRKLLNQQSQLKCKYHL